MDVLYPNLHERFKGEGVCPICMMEMELTPRYSCANGHTVCHRCKPYYYACPTCSSPLDVQIQPNQVPPYPYGPPPTHLMPHPMPMPMPSFDNPSAPPLDDFLNHERHPWGPPTPDENQTLIPCSYSYLGCWIKVPEHLKDIHESRCQFRPHLEEEHLPTDLHHSDDDLVECYYKTVGCNVRMPAWRKPIHEKICIYKDRLDDASGISDSFDSMSLGGDPNALVECKYRKHGCMVRMPRRRKDTHEEKCNYRKYHQDDDGDDDSYQSSEPEDFDPEEQVECKWAEYGCRVKPKLRRKEEHEAKCNYRMEECVYKDYGCQAVFPPARKFAHERHCQFAN